VTNDFGGKLLSRRDVGGIALSETSYAARTTLPRHAHANPYFCFVREGAFEESSARRNSLHTSGTVIFHPAGEEHADRFLDPGAVCFNVEVPESLAGTAAERSVSRTRVRRILDRLHTEFRLSSPSALVLEGLALQMIGEFDRSGRSAQNEDWIAAVREEIRCRFTEPITLSELAATAGVHPVHLSRAFRGRYGIAVARYIHGLRIACARDLLGQAGLSLAHIAAMTGFADQSHFTRAFKQLTGSTPGRYRLEHGR
jgi:AraC family transcriptional regulator